MYPYNGTYKVTNRDWNQSLPEIFNTFVEALKAQQEWDTMATIECIDGDSVEVVWSTDYEQPVSNIFV
jgi:hypothetical protein